VSLLTCSLHYHNGRIYLQVYCLFALRITTLSLVCVLLSYYCPVGNLQPRCLWTCRACLWTPCSAAQTWPPKWRAPTTRLCGLTWLSPHLSLQQPWRPRCLLDLSSVRAHLLWTKAGRGYHAQKWGKVLPVLSECASQHRVGTECEVLVSAFCRNSGTWLCGGLHAAVGMLLIVMTVMFCISEATPPVWIRS
jgi:hypothetical protein